ncbi:MAG: methylaspartate mutase accessory protein GlmL [Tissierellia bacterium]|nr:methylaspartate mutase accessory protein GlmL [Tissierellia bacterium]
MKAYLFIDFGSTNTKVTLVDIENEELVATAKAYTTVETDVMIGYHNAMKILESKVDTEFEIVKKIACSSAAGGLKMIAIGLVPELTSEAAKRAALGAGAKIVGTYSHKINKSEAREIVDSNADMILLAGGTDGGNAECIVHNAKMLKEFGIDIPVVVAGNKSAVDEIEEIFDGHVEYHIAENVMPKLNQLNVDSSRDTIRSIFMENIIKAKGMTHVMEEISGIVMPTPASVLKAAEVLSKGTEDEDGLGDLAIIDIGGATTDVHSACEGAPSKPSVFLRGLEEPYTKRTVEGDLGMRYSIPSVAQVAGKRMLRSYLGSEYDYDIDMEVENRSNDPSFISESKRDLNFDYAIAKACTRISMLRHAGEVEQVYSPTGAMYQQMGKDLMDLPIVIGTGGILVYTENPEEILEACKFTMDEPQSLKPRNPKFYLDTEYILSSMGLLASIDPDMAVRIMKKYINRVGV